MSGLLQDGIERFIADTKIEGRAEVRQVRYPRFQSRAQPAEASCVNGDGKPEPADLSRSAGGRGTSGRPRAQTGASCQDVICYVEDWAVESPEAIDLLDHWATEDVTLVHIREAWKGDFSAGGRVPHRLSALSGRRHLLLGQSSWRTKPGLGFPSQSPCSGWGSGITAFIRACVSRPKVVTPGRRVRMPGGPTGSTSGGPSSRCHCHAGSSGGNLGRQRQPGPDPVGSGDPFFCSWPDAFGPTSSGIQLPGCL